MIATNYILNKFSYDTREFGGYLDINGIPQNVWVNIFFYLSLQGLCSCSQVARRWNQISGSAPVWRSVLSIQPEVIEDFLPFVERNLCSWKDVYRYSPLTSLLNRAFNFTFSEYYTKEYDSYFESNDIKTTNLQVFFKHGQFKFVVSESSKVMMLDGNNQEVAIFMSEQLSMITHLRADGEFLFALNWEGCILQWNIKTKMLVQEIHTCYAQKDLRLQSTNFNDLHGVCDYFFVENGHIILAYPFPSSLIEVIPYRDLERKITLQNEDFFQCRPICIREQKLYMAGQHSVITLDLRGNKPIKTQSIRQDHYQLKLIAVGKHNFFSTSLGSTEKILVNNRITGRKAKPISCSPEATSSFISMKLVGHLLFCVSNQSKILIFDVLSGKHIKTVSNVFDFDRHKINPTIFEELVNICEANKPLMSDEVEVAAVERSKTLTERIQNLICYPNSMSLNQNEST